MGLFTWIKGLGRRGFNTPLSFDEWLATPPPKTAAAINRHLDREITRRRGSNPPAPGSKPVAPAEMPSDQQMERWKRAAIAEHAKGGEPTWRTAALLAFAEGRRQAQSPQIPPPGAEPVATDEELDEELWDVWDHAGWCNDARRAIYARGRADERTAILRALGVEP
jgi:hypothetical protein